MWRPARGGRARLEPGVTRVSTVPTCRQPAGVGSSSPLRRTCGRITCGSGVCVGLPAVLRTAGRRLLLDRSHLTRPESIQLWTTSFPVYDDGIRPIKGATRGFHRGRHPSWWLGPPIRLTFRDLAD